MRKIVFLDVDGTLINYQAKCPDSAKKAVEQALGGKTLSHVPFTAEDVLSVIRKEEA